MQNNLFVIQAYFILNQKHGIPNEKHEQLNCEATIYH